MIKRDDIPPLSFSLLSFPWTHIATQLNPPTFTPPIKLFLLSFREISPSLYRQNLTVSVDRCNIILEEYLRVILPITENTTPTGVQRQAFLFHSIPFLLTHWAGWQHEQALLYHANQMNNPSSSSTGYGFCVLYVYITDAVL
jgi:hypothetical protein